MGPKGLKNSDEELKHGFSVKALILNKLFIKIPTSIKKTNLKWRQEIYPENWDV